MIKLIRVLSVVVFLLAALAYGGVTFVSSQAAVPSGHKVLVATSTSVSYGSTSTKTVTVY